MANADHLAIIDSGIEAWNKWRLECPQVTPDLSGASFIVADLTDPRSVPQELQAIVPDVEIAVQPIIEASHQPFATFVDLMKYRWMLDLRRYENDDQLSSSICELIITPAERCRLDILARRRQAELTYRS